MKEQDIIQYFAEQEAQQKFEEEKKAKEATAKIRRSMKKRPQLEGVGSSNLDSQDIMYLSLNQLFDVSDADKSDPSTQDKLKDIYLWGKEKSNSNDPIGIKLEIRKLQNKLGKSDATYQKLYQYVRLTKEQSLLKEEMKLLGV